MANPIIRSVDDARSHFAAHSYISPLIKACDEATTAPDKAAAMITLAGAISGAISDSDVSALLDEAETLRLENMLTDELSDI